MLQLGVAVVKARLIKEEKYSEKDDGVDEGVYDVLLSVNIVNNDSSKDSNTTNA